MIFGDRVNLNLIYLFTEKFSSCVPKSPIRELLEMEPETAKFGLVELESFFDFLLCLYKREASNRCC